MKERNVRDWDEKSIGDQRGRRYLITGGTSGLGRATAHVLTSHGAHVTITARNLVVAQSIVASGGASDAVHLDLTDLTSIRRAAGEIRESYDVAILNAGIMWAPYRLTIDGFESHMGTNHLGHFAFAGLIRPMVSERFVTVSSLYQRYGSFGDGSAGEIRRRCMGESPYSAQVAYGDSKLANLLFTEEISRRREKYGWPFIAVAAHPGWSNTNLFGEVTSHAGVSGRLTGLASQVFAQSAARGALPQLCAATMPHLRGGEYFGPRGPGQLRGKPRVVSAGAHAQDAQMAMSLWRVSEELTGISWE